MQQASRALLTCIKRLRKRLKSLKRGLPIVEAASPSQQVSVSSMSPPGPSYSTVPPPAKRHQMSHPSQFETRPPNRIPESNPYPPPPERPPYQFYPSHLHAPPLGHYHPGPAYNPQPHVQGPAGPSHAHMGPPPPDVSPYGTNRLNGTPHISAPTPPQAPSARSPTETPPPRHPTTSYDTRPPPPPLPQSGFAAVNHPPPQPGFAAVNSKPNQTPPALHTAPVKEQRHKHDSKSADQIPARASAEDEKIPAGSTNKRTPSSTHPYQMSEAFANRHHHCERTDSLNRGIWTWYGLGGNQDRPTAPATEMYLVCNHDGCRRIDWRTVHGLQCHIVKNHEIPKGTIGSLEKALAAYGVPVSEIEEIEKRHGIGSGGTMADPKNSKLKPRLRESGGTPLSAQKHYQPNNTDSPSSFLTQQKTNSRNQLPPRHDPTPETGSGSTPVNADRQPEFRPSGGFAAVNTAWQGVNATPSKRPPPRDHDLNNGVASEPELAGHAGREAASSGTPASFWSSWQNTTIPPTTEEQSKPRHAESMLQGILAEADPAPNGHVSPVPASAGTIRQESDAMEIQTTGLAKDVKRVEETQQENNGTSDAISKDTDMPKPKITVKDTEMTGTSDDGKAAAELEPVPVVAQPEQSSGMQVDGEKLESKDVAPVAKTEADKQEPQVMEQDASSFMQSPEVSQRSRPSRRESRRTSVATAVSNKASIDKTKEEEVEIASTTHTASKAGSAVDDDGDSITVNVAALKAERERREEDDKTRTPPPPRRLPNGRFTRRTR